MLPIEIYEEQEIKNELEIIKPKILEIYDMNGNKYKDTIPSNLNGILIIRYKDGTYKKTHIN
jgi:bifunctional DNase/RNase